MIMGDPWLSVVVPAYNEEERLPATLEAIASYLASQPFSWEILVVDDGSEDRTAEVACAAMARVPQISLLRLEHRGKGFAVRQGMLKARGEIVLFTDADLSTPIGEIHKLLAALEEGADVAIGSRQVSGAQRHLEPLHRHLMGRVFNYLVRVLAVPGIQDTQCGFKAFRCAAAQNIFSRLRLYADDAPVVRGSRVTGFDVEVLFLARKLGYTVAEVPVLWRHDRRSKVDPLRDSYRMFLDVVRVRLNYIMGRYDLKSQGAVRSSST
jgi:glycosyltransferase involved in cell wall biosynthesis